MLEMLNLLQIKSASVLNFWSVLLSPGGVCWISPGGKVLLLFWFILVFYALNLQPVNIDWLVERSERSGMIYII